MYIIGQMCGAEAGILPRKVSYGQHSGDALFHPSSCCMRGAMQRPWISMPAMHWHGI